jgi:glycosyltransferase involved in cell wall biosynthesis
MKSSPEGRTIDEVQGKTYPRVLIVNGAPIGQKSGIGTLLANFFRGWPRESLAQIVPYGSDPDLSLCNKTWVLDSLNGTETGKLRRGLVASLHRKYELLLGYNLSPELQQWVEDFSPNVIYSYLEHPLITCLATLLSRHLSVPVIPDLRDEWHYLPAGCNLISLWWFIRREIDFKKIIKKAPFGMTTSDVMSKEYQKRYQRRFYTFMSCADASIYIPRQQQRDPLSQKLRIIYTGSGPGLQRWPIILKLAQVVRELNHTGCDIELSIYIRMELCSNLPPQGDGVFLFDFLDERTLADRLGNSDVAILPEGFDRKSITYARLSFSSKLPVYLMSGCCILAIGPIEVNSIQYVKDNNLGVVIHDATSQILSAGLRELYEHWQKWEGIHIHNRQFAIEHHSQQMVHEQLRALLINACSKKLD